YYLFLESSDHLNKVARLDSRQFPGGDYCIDFYYYMYGSGIANLVFNVLAGNTTYHLKTWSGDKGERWYHHRINTHIRNSSTIKFEFEGHTGSSIYSDMAIDDITINLGNCTF
ncbi:MDGA1-like protein, partial [Mya arenaria]